MFQAFLSVLRNDRRLIWVLLTGLIIQVITCITAVGGSSFDQHFSIIEFSSYQLNTENAADYAIELEKMLRPTLQVYLFSGFIKCCHALHIYDPMTQLTILRVLLGILMLAVFNGIAVYYFRGDKKNILFYVLLILNFSWIFPYTRTLYSSEMMSGLVFFAALAIYQHRSARPRPVPYALLSGFLFSLAFFFRFQVGLAFAGLGLWLLFVDKKYRLLPYLLAGFLAGFAINIGLDSLFYGEWVFTPYNYFHHNIILDKASDYGTSGVFKYIGLLLAVMVAPPISILLFWYLVKSLFRNYRNPVLLSVVFFIAGHLFVPHKEERFLYPIFSALPLLIGWSLPEFIQYYNRCRRWIAVLIRVTLLLSVMINTVLLALFIITPYSQTVYFGQKLRAEFRKQPVEIHCLRRTPYETLSSIPMTFYSRSYKNIVFIKSGSPDSLLAHTDNKEFLTATYNELKPCLGRIDSLGYKPVLYSSGFLWKVNRFLHARKGPTINDIWVLYRKLH